MRLLRLYFEYGTDPPVRGSAHVIWSINQISVHEHD